MHHDSVGVEQDEIAEGGLLVPHTVGTLGIGNYSTHFRYLMLAVRTPLQMNKNLLMIFIDNEMIKFL